MQLPGRGRDQTVTACSCLLLVSFHLLVVCSHLFVICRRLWMFAGGLWSLCSFFGRFWLFVVVTCINNYDFSGLILICFIRVEKKFYTFPLFSLIILLVSIFSPSSFYSSFSVSLFLFFIILIFYFILIYFSFSVMIVLISSLLISKSMNV